MKINYFYFILCLIISCGPKAESYVTGIWSIDSIYYNNINIRECLNGNLLVFDKAIEFPITRDYCPKIIETYVGFGKWRIGEEETKGYYLEVFSKNKMFNGKFKITFSKDDKVEMLKMTIESSRLRIISRKGLFSVSRNDDAVRYLIEHSNKK